jgi:hypothetical protein
MELTLGERFSILTIMPAQGNYATLRLVNDMRMILAPSEKELTEQEIKEEHNAETGSTSLRWKDEKYKADIDLTPKMLGMIVKRLEELDVQAKLEANTLELFEKFVKTEDKK